MEASIAKVAGSETLNFVLDENIQIHGGNGYVRDYPAERHFRDARVNRIFEGTNEINRLLIPGMLARRAVKGDLGIIPAARALQDELLGPPAMAAADGGPLAEEARIGRRAQEGGAHGLRSRHANLWAGDGGRTGSADAPRRHADRRLQRGERRPAGAGRVARPASRARRSTLDAARVFVNDAAMRVEASAKQALAAMAEGDPLRTMLAALRRLLKATPVNTVALRRRMADAAVSHGGYPF